MVKCVTCLVKRRAGRPLAVMLGACLLTVPVAAPHAARQAPVVTPIAAQGATQGMTQGWQTYKSPPFGYSVSLPDGLLIRDTTKKLPNGSSIWMTKDRSARLIVTAGPNPAKSTIADYRAIVIKDSYAGLRFDFAPQQPTWFALSGYKGDRIFYERVIFACDGRFIYGWQMMYPKAQREKYDRIVEAVHQGFQAGRGTKGNCQQ